VLLLDRHATEVLQQTLENSKVKDFS